jgi:hypothetical protein
MAMHAATQVQVQMYRLEERIRPALGEPETAWSSYMVGHHEAVTREIRKLRKDVGGTYAGEPEYRIVPVE